MCAGLLASSHDTAASALQHALTLAFTITQAPMTGARHTTRLLRDGSRQPPSEVVCKWPPVQTWHSIHGGIHTQHTQAAFKSPTREPVVVSQKIDKYESVFVTGLGHLGAQPSMQAHMMNEIHMFGQDTGESFASSRSVGQDLVPRNILIPATQFVSEETWLNLLGRGGK